MTNFQEMLNLKLREWEEAASIYAGPPVRHTAGMLGEFPDERLTVSPEVMACLEADFPDAARLFQVDPITEQFRRFPMRWATGLVDWAEASGAMSSVWAQRLIALPDDHEVEFGWAEP